MFGRTHRCAQNKKRLNYQIYNTPPLCEEEVAQAKRNDGGDEHKQSKANNVGADRCVCPYIACVLGAHMCLPE